MTLHEEKCASLLAAFDLTRPELAPVKNAPSPVSALTAHLRRPPRPAFLFEYNARDDLLAYLRENYASWRDYDRGPADAFGAKSIEEAQEPRALSGIRCLGEAWWATGDPVFGEAFERFYTRVPTGDMFNWGSFNGRQATVELDAWFLLRDCPGLSEEGRVAWLDHMQAITADAWDNHTSRWGHRTLGPEGHNWYLHGSDCLPFVGLLFPELRRAEFYRLTGRGVWEEHIRGHYQADGGARETCIGYQGGSVQNLWDFVNLAQRNGLRLSGNFVPRLLNATKFLLRLATPRGSLPSFGDGGHKPGSLTLIAALAAAIAGDEECKGYAETFRHHQPGAAGEEPGSLPYCAFWKVGLAGAKGYEQLAVRAPEQGSVLQTPTGYAALRDGTFRKANFLSLAGATRGPIVTSHGHNDIFAMEVHAGGTRFLGEMGCAPYGGGEGRWYDQLTEAHNCLAVEGMEQQELVSEWRWSGMTVPRFRRWITTDSHDILHGVHEGFMRLPESETIHARKVIFIKSAPSYWIVIDRLLASRENTYAAWFHGCVPGKTDGTQVRLTGGETDLLLLAPERDGIAFNRETTPGLAAYRTIRKLDPEGYPAFVARKTADNAGLVWVLFPVPHEGKAPRVERLACRVNGLDEDSSEATALRITHIDGVRDEICVSHKDFDGELDFANATTWGWFAWRRTAADGTRQMERVHGMADGEAR